MVLPIPVKTYGKFYLRIRTNKKNNNKFQQDIKLKVGKSIWSRKEFPFGFN